MAIFNERPSISLGLSLRKYWARFTLFTLNPILVLAVLSLFQDAPPSLFIGLVFLGTAVLVMWPAAFWDAPISFWMLACGCWFVVTTSTMLLGDFVEAQPRAPTEQASYCQPAR